MKHITLCVLFFYNFLFICLPISHAKSDLNADNLSNLVQYKWQHGAINCAEQAMPAIDVFEYNEDTFILRQSKCNHFEAPFIYLLFGEKTLFVQDTGATENSNEFPLFNTIKHIIMQRAEKLNIEKNIDILVTHSHSHSDHIAGDSQFTNQPNVTVVPSNITGVISGLHIANWPIDNAILNLGNRELIIIPIPGHQDESIAIYDEQSGWILTGDTFYPGRLYIKNWTAYKTSINKLLKFSKVHAIKAFMGTHIEMSNVAGVDFPMDNHYQPNEHPLPLLQNDLNQLVDILEALEDKPTKVISDSFIVYPVK